LAWLAAAFFFNRLAALPATEAGASKLKLFNMHAMMWLLQLCLVREAVGAPTAEALSSSRYSPRIVELLNCFQRTYGHGDCAKADSLFRKPRKAGCQPPAANTRVLTSELLHTQSAWCFHMHHASLSMNAMARMRKYFESIRLSDAEAEVVEQPSAVLLQQTSESLS
jgi:hypothetical protein